MSLLPDPRALALAARRLEDHADDLRRQAGQLAASSQSTRWVSSAAARFRDHAIGLSHDLRRCAVRVDDAAADLRSHAATVGSRVAAIEASVELAAIVEREGLSALREGVGVVAGVGARAWQALGF